MNIYIYIYTLIRVKKKKHTRLFYSFENFGQNRMKFDNLVYMI